MEFEFGARVLSSDDKDVGSIDRLIVDPQTGDLKAVAIRQNGFLQHDIEVTIDKFAADEAPLRLTLTAERAALLPVFVEERYTAAPAGFAPLRSHPDASTLVPVDPVYGAAINDDALQAIEASAEWGAELEEERLENAVIKDGSDVHDREGHHLGKIEGLGFDASGLHLDHFTIRRGLLGLETLTLPATLVESIDEKGVTLSVGVGWLGTWQGLARGMEVRAIDGTVLGTVVDRDIDSVTVQGVDGGRYRVPQSAVAEGTGDEVALSVSPEEARAWAVGGPTA